MPNPQPWWPPEIPPGKPAHKSDGAADYGDWVAHAVDALRAALPSASVVRLLDHEAAPVADDVLARLGVRPYGEGPGIVWHPASNDRHVGKSAHIGQ